MNIPTVRLVADIPKPLKKKLMKIALERDMAIKHLVIEWLESLPDTEDSRIVEKIKKGS